MVGASETTARERSEHGLLVACSALTWVWPRWRVDRLQGGRLGIGRDDGAAIQLLGTGVSREHAELNRQGPVYVLHDLQSTNGTWVGGRAIEHAPLTPGDVVRIGEWVGVFTEYDAPEVEFGELAPGLFGGTELARLIAPLKQVATSNVPVALVGETGTGKERFAHAVHQFSGRRGPFVAVNCAALPEQLAEAELFGYRRGAFTGAERNSPGHFRAADGGTLFLDEMPELSPALQAKLLRTVETGEVLGLGDSNSARVDVRVVSAGQLPLAELVAKKRLRRDLAARFRGLELQLPALAKRRADIAPLFLQFLRTQSGGRPPELEPRLIEALCVYDWPDNVRELELTTRTLLAMHGRESVLKRQHLPPAIATVCAERPSTASASQAPRPRRDHDLAHLRQQLEANGGNVKATAAALGLSRQRVYRLLEGSVATFRKPTDGGGDDGARD
jgi:transcriptional regulator of acetoin/glycerol metabolism